MKISLMLKQSHAKTFSSKRTLHANCIETALCGKGGGIIMVM